MPTIMSKIAEESNDPLLHLHNNYGVPIHYLCEMCGNSNNYQSLLKNTTEHTIPNIDDELDADYYNLGELDDWVSTSEEVVRESYLAAMKKLKAERKTLEAYKKCEKQNNEFKLEKMNELCEDVQRHIFEYLPYDLQAGVYMENWQIMKKKLNNITTARCLRGVCKNIEKNYYERPRRRGINHHSRKFEQDRRTRELRHISRLWARPITAPDSQILVDFRNLTLKSATKKGRLYDVECLINLLINANGSRKEGLYNSAKKMHYLGFKLVNVIRYLTS